MEKSVIHFSSEYGGDLKEMCDNKIEINIEKSVYFSCTSENGGKAGELVCDSTEGPLGIINKGSGSQKSNRPQNSQEQYIPEGQSDRMNNATIPFIAQYGNNSGD